MFAVTPITSRQRTETAILLAIVGLLVAVSYQDWRLVWLSGGILLLSLVAPIIFHPLALVWFGLAKVLSIFSSTVLLTLLFLLLVTPVGWVRKWLGKDTLQRKDFKKSQQSVLKVRNHRYEPADLKHPF